jgi:hypothetical protein
MQKMSLDSKFCKVSMFIANKLTFNLNLKIGKEWKKNKKTMSTRKWKATYLRPRG